MFKKLDNACLLFEGKAINTVKKEKYKVLITGKNSFVGKNLKNYLEKYGYEADLIGVRDDAWKKADFSMYDVIYHVAAIVHKGNKVDEDTYYRVNTNLTIELAKKAKNQGVRHFIFISTMNVYGLTISNDSIDLDTPVNPLSPYGKSKFLAEEKLRKLQDANFMITFVRPPMIYGEDAPGNLGKLIRLVSKVHIFPAYSNERSAINIEGLCQVAKYILDDNVTGVVLCQDNEYMCTYKVIKKYCDERKIKVHYTRIFNQIIKLLVGKITVFSKVFGDLKYGK
ncbi:UDP-glucose 4-epimerase [Ligilactobacillus sp. WC1T17]|uniref:UDP-glucose 4-epimerase n=1 Tax=Ligilactobacillus ruminis TaxID=1623 RepID=A0ABY1A8X3_9LACO|nr:UDP-glucose 4-epimerase [Ligilactobacillus ruminis]